MRANQHNLQRRGKLLKTSRRARGGSRADTDAELAAVSGTRREPATRGLSRANHPHYPPRGARRDYDNPPMPGPARASFHATPRDDRCDASSASAPRVPWIDKPRGERRPPDILAIVVHRDSENRARARTWPPGEKSKVATCSRLSRSLSRADLAAPRSRKIPPNEGGGSGGFALLFPSLPAAAVSLSLSFSFHVADRTRFDPFRGFLAESFSRNGEIAAAASEQTQHLHARYIHNYSY